MSSAGQVVGGVVGAVVGYFAGGNVVLGAQIGMSIGGAIDQPDGPDGPRVEETQGSMSVGNLIPLPFGLVPVSGSVIWAAPSVEHSDDSGGKGSMSQTSTTFFYTRSYAVMFGGRARTSILMLRRNGEVVYDKRRQQTGESDSSYQTRMIAAQGFEDRNEIHTGQASEVASPTIETYEGIGNVPAFRGRPYIVLIDEDVTNTSRQPASWESVWSDDAGPSADTTEYSNEVMFPWNQENLDPSNCLNDHQFRACATISDATQSWRTTFAEAFDDLVTLRPSLATYGYELSEDVRGYLSRLTVYDRYMAPYANADVPDEGQTYLLALYPFQPAVTLPYNTSGCGIWDYPLGEWMQAVSYDASSGLNANLYFLTTPILSSGNLYNFLAANDTGGQTNKGVDLSSFNCPGLGSTNIHAQSLRPFVVEVERLPRAPESPCVPRCTETPLDLPDNPDYCVIGGSIESKTGWTLHATTYKMLSILTYTSNILTRYPRNPARPTGHADYTSQAFWDAAYAAAVIAGELPSGMTYNASGSGGATTYPRTQSYGYTRTTTEYSDNDGDGVTVSTIVAELCSRSGLEASDIYADDLTMLIDGFTIAQQTTARAAIEQLGQYGLFLISESDKIRFPLRGVASSLTFEDEQLGAHPDGTETPERWTSADTEDIELPKSVNLKYFERDLYAPGSQTQRKILTDSDSEMQINLAITMGGGQASALGLFHLLDAYVARRVYEFAIGPRQLELEPGDVITLPDGEETQRVRILETQSDPFTITKCRAARDDEEIIDVEGTGASQPNPQSGIQFVGPTFMVPLDIPLLQDADNNPGYYMAVYGGLPGWRGAHVDRSFDNSTFARLISNIPGSTVGVVEDALADFTGGNVFDRTNTLTVQLEAGETLTSATEADLLNYANIAAVKSGDGWELIQFADATLQTDDTYVLSTLLRGRRGTEYLIDGHLAGDAFVLLTDALRRANLDLAKVGSELWHRAISIGAPGEQTSEAFTNDAVGLLPYAVASLRGSRVGSTVTFTWLRRTRFGGKWTDAASEVPLNEDSELYEYEAKVTEVIVSSGTQATKSLVVVNAAPITLTVWQISGQVGRGTPSEITA